MDGGGAYWAEISRWFTPTIFFCLLNLMVASIYILSSMKPKKNNQEHQQNRLVHEGNDPVQFFRVSSLLERVKSINFSRSYQTYHAEEEEITQHAEPEVEPEKKTVEVDEDEVEEEGHVARTMSDNTIVESVVKQGVKMMKKSQSAKIVRVEETEAEKPRPATMRESKGNVNGTVPFSEDEAVDAKADDFINRFKQQLKLQRIESLLKYRGASK